MSRFKAGDKVRQKEPFAYRSIGDAIGRVESDYHPGDMVDVEFTDLEEPDSGTWPFFPKELELVND